MSIGAFYQNTGEQLSCAVDFTIIIYDQCNVGIVTVQRIVFYIYARCGCSCYCYAADGDCAGVRIGSVTVIVTGKYAVLAVCYVAAVYRHRISALTIPEVNTRVSPIYIITTYIDADCASDRTQRNSKMVGSADSGSNDVVCDIKSRCGTISQVVENTSPGRLDLVVADGLRRTGIGRVEVTRLYTYPYAGHHVVCDISVEVVVNQHADTIRTLLYIINLVIGNVVICSDATAVVIVVKIHACVGKVLYNIVTNS
ncbi:MAG: hypothetical protein EPGJADBJ_02702 [Saprospiraceae bacterium]|nr:hypothetical protein [Saprospiraceae bacterium]